MKTKELKTQVTGVDPVTFKCYGADVTADPLALCDGS